MKTSFAGHGPAPQQHPSPLFADVGRGHALPRSVLQEPFSHLAREQTDSEISRRISTRHAERRAPHLPSVLHGGVAISESDPSLMRGLIFERPGRGALRSTTPD